MYIFALGRMLFRLVFSQCSYLHSECMCISAYAFWPFENLLNVLMSLHSILSFFTHCALSFSYSLDIKHETFGCRHRFEGVRLCYHWRRHCRSRSSSPLVGEPRYSGRRPRGGRKKTRCKSLQITKRFPSS